MIASEQQLEDLLSEPSGADARAMSYLEGDLVILGVAGKMGPSLAKRARRACDWARLPKRIIGVARFSEPQVREELEAAGIETVSLDLLEPGAMAKLPDAPNVLYMAARKFGSTGQEHLTWAMNTMLPALVADRYAGSRIVAFSTGNVYPLVPVTSGGASETTPAGPIGEYAQSALGRERIFEFFSHRNGTPMMFLRLNYAIDLRYGVLLDIGQKVFERRPVDVTMGHVNVIWQGDANSIALRAFAHCQAPPAVLNVTGPEILAVRWIAQRFGERFGVEPAIEGREAETALINNAAHCHRLFGYPAVTVEQMIEWVADWIGMGGATHAKPTHFETRDGRF
ncbi:MAG TPA: NAD-dependent epimerase/dehydratase family protein [Bryobacteraceae bacterium]|nr:NAD-dependent epimerase/dehydratase family protein [Bryobacteraceae bacterium]